MAEVLTCPKCERKLQVPETLMGQDVQCPTCAATFLAQLGGSTAPPASAATPSPSPPSSASRELDRPRRRAEYDDDDFDDDYRERRPMRRRRRHDYEPHRGSLIMTLGIISLFFAHLILGPIAWIMANHDLEAMRTGKMDPEGESSTNTGRICGMIATILGILGILAVVAFFCLMFLVSAAAVSTVPKRGKGF
jgi:hypothetical protein